MRIVVIVIGVLALLTGWDLYAAPHLISGDLHFMTPLGVIGYEIISYFSPNLVGTFGASSFSVINVWGFVILCIGLVLVVIGMAGRKR
jgi:hypothetical protein